MNENHEPHRLFTVSEVAELFQLSRATVYRLMNAGRLAFVQIGGRKRFRQELIEHFLNQAQELTSSAAHRTLQSNWEHRR